MGNVLPTFVFSFRSREERLLSKLNEGQLVKVRSGIDPLEVKEVTLSISKLKTTKEGEEYINYECSGFASNIKYITNPRTGISGNVSGIERASELISNYFKLSSNITKSRDKQNWISYGISDKLAVNKCLLHCNLPNSFPVYAITGDGRFILRDFKKYAASAAQTPVWNLTRNANGPKDIIFDSDPILESKSGFMNNWLGYGRKLLSNNVEKGIIQEILEGSSITLAMSKEIEKSKGIATRFAGTEMLSDNVDPNYWNSYYRNLQGLANLSRIELAVSYSNQFFNVQPLDLFMFNETALDSETRYADYHSGLYVLSNLVTSIVNKNFDI